MRIARVYPKRFSQARLCHDIASDLTHDVRPHGVAVYIEAEHFCTQSARVTAIDLVHLNPMLRGAYNKNPLLSAAVAA